MKFQIFEIDWVVDLFHFRFGLICVGAFALSACSTTTKIDAVGAAHPSKSPTCEISIVEGRVADYPHFDVIAKIESHKERNMFFGGRAELKQDAFKDLRLQACSLGGDRLVIEDVVESSAAEASHIHVWATLLKAR